MTAAHATAAATAIETTKRKEQLNLTRSEAKWAELGRAGARGVGNSSQAEAHAKRSAFRAYKNLQFMQFSWKICHAKRKQPKQQSRTHVVCVGVYAW